MRRGSKRHIEEYFDNEEFNETSEEFEEFEDFNVGAFDEADSYDEDAYYDEDEELDDRKGVWVKIGKIALIVLVLIALFFVSMKVTEIFLDRNQEPVSYGEDAPAYSDETEEEDTPEIIEEMEEYKEEDLTVVPQKPEESETEKPAEKPAETPGDKPSEKPSDKPEETPAETPSTPEVPSTPSKPSIIPGNPAA